MLINKKDVFIGKGARIEEGVIIGYKPVRKIENAKLIIGSGSLVMTGAIIYGGASIGKKAIIAHNAVIREENRIGDNFCLWNNSIIDYGCKIGDNVKIHCNAYVAQFTEIEDGVFIGPGTTIANDLHPKCKFSKRCMKGPRINRGAVIGANVTINPFVNIGEMAGIGAGSVVTRDIPDRKVAYGSPAKIAGDISQIRCRRGFIDFPYNPGICNRPFFSKPIAKSGIK